MVRCRVFVLLVALPLAYAEAHAQAQTPTLPPPSPPAQLSTQPNTQAPAPARSATPAAVPHAIVVTFDYDFSVTPACTAQVREKCVKQFVIYDISGGPQKPFRIGIVPLPDNPSGKKQGITGKSDPHVFEPGKHLIAVTAQESEPASSSTAAEGPQPKPLESPTTGCASCTTWVTIP